MFYKFSTLNNKFNLPNLICELFVRVGLFVVGNQFHISLVASLFYNL